MAIGMRAALLVVTSACWTGATPPFEAPPAQPGRCAINEVDVQPNGSAKLSIEGKAFASLTGPFPRIAVTFQGSRARARVETEVFVIDGDLDLEGLPLRPRELDLRDDWVEIRRAFAKTAIDASLRIEVGMPAGVSPATVPFTIPCAGLTFATPPDPPESSDEPELFDIAINTELRAKPGGPVVGRVVGTSGLEGEVQSMHVTVIERRAGNARVRLDGDNPISVWVPGKALGPPMLHGLGGFGFGRSGVGRHQYTCTRDTPIYVRLGTRVVKVGRVKKEGGFYLDEGRADDEDEHPIELGIDKPEVRPFIKAVDFSHCG